MARDFTVGILYRPEQVLTDANQRMFRVAYDRGNNGYFRVHLLGTKLYIRTTNANDVEIEKEVGDFN